MKSAIIFLLFSSVACKSIAQKNVRYFHNGDILTPSNVNKDSLIVTNEKGLNKSIALYEQGYKSFTLSQLSTIFYSNSIQYKKVGNKINDLIEQGYSLQWATKIVLVENKIIAPDSEYRAIIED